MIDSSRNIHPKILAVVGGCIVLSLIGVLFWLSTQIPKEASQIQQTEVASLSAFERGQYYFNHDDDPSGPYDLVLAQEAFEEAIALDPSGNELSWYQLGRIHFLNGEFDRALEIFNTQIEYFNDVVPNVYYMIGLTYGYKARATGDTISWQKAEEAFLKSVAYFPEAPWPRVDLAWVYFAQGKYEEMKPILKEGIKYEANNPWLLNMYGLALYNTGDETMAKEYFIFAQELSEKITVEEWGKTYPGNNPAFWEQGLLEFRELIALNVALVP